MRSLRRCWKTGLWAGREAQVGAGARVAPYLDGSQAAVRGGARGRSAGTRARCRRGRIPRARLGRRAFRRTGRRLESVGTGDTRSPYAIGRTPASWPSEGYAAESPRILSGEWRPSPSARGAVRPRRLPRHRHPRLARAVTRSDVQRRRKSRRPSPHVGVCLRPGRLRDLRSVPIHEVPYRHARLCRRRARHAHAVRSVRARANVPRRSSASCSPASPPLRLDEAVPVPHRFHIPRRSTGRQAPSPVEKRFQSASSSLPVSALWPARLGAGGTRAIDSGRVLRPRRNAASAQSVAAIQLANGSSPQDDRASTFSSRRGGLKHLLERGRNVVSPEVAFKTPTSSVYVSRYQAEPGSQECEDGCAGIPGDEVVAARDGHRVPRLHRPRSHDELEARWVLGSPDRARSRMSSAHGEECPSASSQCTAILDLNLLRAEATVAAAIVICVSNGEVFGT